MTPTSTTQQPQPTETRALLTIGEAADYLTITKATLYTWRSRRTGYGPPAAKVAGWLRFRRTDLDAWIADHTEGPEHLDNGVDSLRGKAPNPAAGIPLTRQASSHQA